MYRLLIVEDEDLERNALEYIISNNIDKVKIVGTTGCGKEALSLNEKFDPHIIIMDIHIMSMDGIKVSSQIKKLNSEKRIIIISAYDEFTYAHRAIKANVEDYLLKPVRPKYVIEAIEKNIAQLDKKISIDMDVIKANIKDDYETINKIMDKVMIYISNNIKKNITLEEISKYVNMSPSYFSRTFKKEIGMNYTTYLMNKKMEVAKKLLADTTIPVNNIALELSYKEANYFSKVFRRHVGKTPTAYRLEHGKEVYVKNNKILNGKWYV